MSMKALDELIEQTRTNARVQRQLNQHVHEAHVAEVATLLSGTPQQVKDAIYATAIEHAIPAGITLEWIRDFLVTFTSSQEKAED